MESVVAGGLFHAVAFAGAGYVFHKLDKKGYEDEMKRHNLAVEQLQAAKEKWYEKTVHKKNKIALLQQKLRCQQRFRRYEQSVSQSTDGNGRKRWTGTDVERLLRTVRRHENVYKRRHRRNGIGSGSFSKQNVIVIS